MNNKIKFASLAVISAALAGALAFGSGANAQTPSPTATPNATRPAQGAGPRGGGPRGGMHFGDPANSPRAIVAKLLSMDEAALHTELHAGKTIADLAKSKGVALDSIASAILDAQKANLAKAVTDGKLTQAQADQMLADAPTRINNMLNGTAPAGGPRGGGKGGQGQAGPAGAASGSGPSMNRQGNAQSSGQQDAGPRGGGPRGAHIGDPANAPHVIAAKLLGLDEAALRTELQAGKTISDVAASKGVALNTIASAILDAQKADLAKAVTDGKLTQAQADQILANAPARINTMLTTARPQGGRQGGPRGNGTQTPKPSTTPAPRVSPTTGG
ncbi:MAG: hypothetical protein KIH69_004875 [Anaerolineae bacterium]|nr:hypothetical protein [Anaerolineae bacterium]